MTDPLADWYRHTLSVERWSGDDAYRDTFDAAVDVTGFYSDETQYSGGQIVASGRFAYPSTVAFIPLQSRITLPAAFAERSSHVIAVARRDGGGLPLPEHLEVSLQ